MVKKLTSHGNSAALIIDKPILELLKINLDTLLEIATDGKSLIVSPVSDTNREQAVQKALSKMNARHGNTLKKLAG
ncbi:MAG: AbrB/MazE/SpoVT family DNA-binding domain-containing protein [Candidatus Schekmanbacteria bacterium]|nr:AbrB/MazE/SpoVT family DNA-binding domain-containing protein [Candidatus Schekmanbacteria bacterium]